MTDATELYQELLLEHNDHPKHYGELKNHNREIRGFNPLCGDDLTLYLSVKNEIITEISFVTKGCAISKASASLMSEAIKGKTVEESKELFSLFHQLVTEGTLDEAALQKLGDVEILKGVREFPVRVKCATLAWRALEAALIGEQSTITTE